MSQSRVLSYQLLGTGPDPPGDIVAYMDSLLDLHEDFHSLERELVNVPLGYTGWRCNQKLNNIAQRHLNLLDELREARKGVVESQPTRFSRWGGKWDEATRSEFDDHWAKLLDRINRIEKTSERVKNTLVSRRNAAHTRMVATLSLAAVLVAVLSLLIQ